MTSAQHPAASSPLLLTTGRMRALLPEVFYRNPLPSAVHELSEEARYIEVNDAWLAFFGLERDQVLGKPLREIQIWASDEQRLRLRERLQQNPRMRDVEGVARRAGGTTADILVSTEPFEQNGRDCLLSVFTDITARKQAERLLRRSEARFAAIFESSPLAMTVARRVDGVYLQVNRAYEHLLGFNRDEVLGKSTLELGIWADPEARARLIRQFAGDGTSASVEAQVRRKDGSLIDVIFTGALIELDGVEVIHGTVQDMSELRRIGRLRAESEARFEKLVEFSPLPMTVTRLDTGVYLGVNLATETLLGYQRGEMLGRSSLELGIWVDPAVRDELRRNFAAGQVIATVETRVRAKDGHLIDIQFSATVIELGGVEVLHGTVFDLTSIKQATRLKDLSEERAAKLFRANPAPVVITNLVDALYVDMNDAWVDLFGYSRTEAIGHTALELGIWVDPAERERLIDEVRRAGAARGFETRLRRRSGEIVEVIISAEAITLEGVDSLIICTTDITDRKRLERLRARSEARFARVFQAGPHPIVLSRAEDGLDIQVNRAWHQLLGYTAQDIEGQSSSSINLWVDPNFRVWRQKVLICGESVRDVETQMRTKSGAVIDVQISSEQFDLEGVPYVVSVVTDVTAKKVAARQIEYLATRDYLTGLPNRLLFTDRLHQALTKAEREDTRLALMFIDLDHFKNINDSLGHQAGDYVLIEIAARLTAAVRGADTIGRQGGDEFLLLIEGLTAAGDARPVAEKVVAALSEPVLYNGQQLKLSCSTGISVYPDDAGNAADLMRNADLAMYAAKAAGRNAFRFFTAGMNRRLIERMTMETQLRGALERGEFVLHYQPKVGFESGAVTGCEALLRWRRDSSNLLVPGRFIQAAEESGLIVPIGTWVLREACLSVRRWLDAGLTVVPVACNVSVHQFTPALPQLVGNLLRETGVPGHLLQLEITETVMMNNVSAHLDTMRGLKELGVQIALDDFGTGYSSLSYLRHMDLDVLKIDRSFVRDVAVNTDAQAIVSAIIAMAGKFGMKTVAEGVESPAQAAALRGMQCDEYQGYLFSAAVPVGEFEAGYLWPA